MALTIQTQKNSITLQTTKNSIDAVVYKPSISVSTTKNQITAETRKNSIQITVDRVSFIQQVNTYPIIDTRDNILSQTPETGRMAVATDTQELLFYDGSQWWVLPLEFKVEKREPDMGYIQTSDKMGYGADYITDKTLTYVKLGAGAKDEEGAFRVINGKFQVYLNGTWNDIVLGFRLREDQDGTYTFEHKPIGFTEWIEIFSGNSNSVGLNGRPIVQQYSVSMGAYPPPLQINGGTF